MRKEILKDMDSLEHSAKDGFYDKELDMEFRHLEDWLIASTAMSCRDLCGLWDVEETLDFDEYEDEEWYEYEDFDEQPSLWVQFLGERFGCYPDSVGNMPCDNGRVCDKCHYADAEFQQFKKGRE